MGGGTVGPGVTVILKLNFNLQYECCLLFFFRLEGFFGGMRRGLTLDSPHATTL